jgi:drug/metabolite transporter (DMT)-like permease
VTPLLPATALTMTAFAANSVLNRLAIAGGHIGAVEFALVRLAAGALALVLLVLWRRGAVFPGWKGRPGGVAGLTIYLFGFTFAYQALDAGTGALILFGAVQLSMFAGAILLGESIPARRYAGAGLAFAGLVVLLWPGEIRLSPLHAGFMIAAGFGWGLYSLKGRGEGDPLASTAANFTLALPFALALGWWLDAGLAWGNATGWGLAILSGAVTSGLGYALWYTILPALGAARAGVAQLTVPLIAAAGGLVLIGEPVTFRFALAAAVILGGVAWATWERRDRA